MQAPLLPHMSASRRKFVSDGLKLAALAGIIPPFQNAMATGAIILKTAEERLHYFILTDKLVLNTKTKVLHLPTGKVFKKYSNIKSQKIIGFNEWENVLKPPFHFSKDKSGIILEMLTLQKLNEGINDKTLTDAYRILSIGFTPVYKSKKGVLINKYNFRLHHLLLQIISLNGTIANEQKWAKFQSAVGGIDYNLKDKKSLPKYMNWLKSKSDFDRKMNKVVQYKSAYISRLTKRAAKYKL